MPLAPFVPFTAGAPPDADSETQFPEDLLRLPYPADPQFSWVDYRCWVEVELDPGLALHKPLPQKGQETPDQLGQVDCQSPQLDRAEGGVALTGVGVLDVVQRMATATYRFRLRGWGLRAGVQVPIPKLVKVGAALAVPDAPQRAYNVIVGNLNGVPLWFAQWELPYLIASSPGEVSSPGLAGASGAGVQAPVPFNPALRARPDAQLPPDGLRLPRTQTDQQSAQVHTLRPVFFPPGGRRP